MQASLKALLLISTTLAFGLALPGCAMTPGLVPGIGGRTVIEREFYDSDSRYSESIKAPAGVDVSQLSRFSLQLKDGANDVEYNVGLDAESDADTTAQAALLAQISADSLAALRDALKTIESLAPIIAAPPKPSPISVPITLPIPKDTP